MHKEHAFSEQNKDTVWNKGRQRANCFLSYWHGEKIEHKQEGHVLSSCSISSKVVKQTPVVSPAGYLQLRDANANLLRIVCYTT